MAAPVTGCLLPNQHGRLDRIKIELDSCISSYTIELLKLKPIWWEGPSKEELLAFPRNAIQDAGYQLHRLQDGKEPQDSKLLKDLGKSITGVYEIRIREDSAIFRVAYVRRFRDYVTVLHCWQKTSQATAKVDKDIIVTRYRDARDGIKNESQGNNRQRF